VSCLVSAIVVAYAEDEAVARCLRSVELALAEVAGETELIVVLNRPVDRSRHAFRDSWIVVEPGRNLGFTGGVSAGLARARGQWVALVNDDSIVEANAIAELLSAGEASDDVGSVAAQIRFASRVDTINSAGIEVDGLGIAYERLLGEPTTRSGNEVEDVFGASAGAALYRRIMLEELGGFDESFFAYLEDADLAWRARMQGWRCVYAPRAVVLHHHSVSLGHRSEEKYFLVGRNRIRMLAKNATRGQLLRRWWAMALYDLAYVAFGIVTARSLAPLRGRLSGLQDWSSYRAAGRPYRGSVELASPAGLRRALRRDRAYGAS
jgi:GT2 family glycosyltransferase